MGSSGDEFALARVRTDDLARRTEWFAAPDRVIGTEFHDDSSHIQMCGDGAEAKSPATQAARTDGKPWEGEFLPTAVLIRGGGRQKAVTRDARGPSGSQARGQMSAAP